MASSKYATHKSMVKVLSFLFGAKEVVNKKDLLDELNLKNPYQLMYYLRKNEYIDIKESNGISEIYISEKGKEKVLKYKVDDLSINRPKRWDRKWRLVVFDIPEKQKQARNLLSAKLKELGFKTIQKSVYIYPYPCLDEIEFIRTIYGIRNFVFLATVENIEGGERLKKLFKV